MYISVHNICTVLLKYGKDQTGFLSIFCIYSISLVWGLEKRYRWHTTFRAMCLSCLLCITDPVSRSKRARLKLNRTSQSSQSPQTTTANVPCFLQAEPPNTWANKKKKKKTKSGRYFYSAVCALLLLFFFQPHTLLISRAVDSRRSQCKKAVAELTDSSKGHIQVC